ncbi:MAG: ABC transporter permease subunit [Oscillospiraceae bacterium]|nr:ABC transporter permease subunit [Oscillospiraceae bacterium]
MAFIRRIYRARKFVTLCWFLGLIAVWEVFAVIVGLTQRTPMNVLPHTYQIIGSLLDGKTVAGHLTMAQIITAACAETLTRAGQGFIVGALLGSSLALLMDISKIVERIAFPYLMIIQMIPILGMAPIILAITRDIDKSRIIIAAVLTFYPVSANTLAGFKAVEHEKKELMFSYSANKLQVYVKTMIPAALPFFFSGLKISAPMAITASILVDTLQGGTGLGCMLSQSLKGGMTRMVFWDIVVISAAVGILSFSLMGLVEKLACPHRNRRRIG